MRVRLRTSALLVALVSAMMAGCGGFDETRYLPTSPDFTGALDISVSAASIPADGFSTINVTARITPDAAPARRTLVFVTTKGTFAGSGTPESATIEVGVDSTGTATVQLRSSKTVESATVSVQVKSVAGLVKQAAVSFTPPGTSSQVEVITGAATAPADGSTITLVTAQIPAGLPAGRRKVVFTTTRGRFVAAPGGAAATDDGKRIESDADASNRALAFLRSPADAPGDAFISASVDPTPGISATTQLVFTRAVPDRALVTTTTASVSASFASTTLVTVTLLRDVGTPTQNTVVRFSATDSAGHAISFFSAVTTSNDQGIVTATFTPGSGAATGSATIRVTVDGTSVSATTTIQVTPAT